MSHLPADAHRRLEWPPRMVPVDAPIYVVVAGDDLHPYWLTRKLAEDPNRKPNPIVFETNVIGSTLQRERERAAQAERQGYGSCRVARLVFEDIDGTPL